MEITDDELANQILKLARETKYGLNGFLTEVVEGFQVEGTKVLLKTFHVNLGGNGLPRIRDLHKALARHTLDYAIPRSKILEAAEEFYTTQSSAKMTALVDESRSLFTSLATTGEGGELLLFALCEQVLKLPLVIAKMNLKTDSEMHFHGADGVYAGFTDDKALALYWGESKIYQDRSKAANDCFNSLAKLLLPSDETDSEEDRDIELLRDYSDLGSPELTSVFQEWLKAENPAFNEIEFRGVCLIGFDEKSYPTSPNELDNTKLREDLENRVLAYQKTVKHYVEAHSLTAFHLTSVCLPIPSADEFRKQFLEVVVKKGEKDS